MINANSKNIIHHTLDGGVMNGSLSAPLQQTPSSWQRYEIWSH